ncbi:helix-turn-helix domain-containing protein [Glycomyces sp. A-F 0318]|uniref:IclR family transcriptional regulator domain-containing protein n=1 Tax=Glycomyces amatae TaxID=2881355 RepID=UPI001E3B9BF7|nr:IclR family transcriptional regulator C-terminal domain-containing protein [Glycomyces amatae]MCD0444262.1 helix-turn-helix domain-containing protein [Glycomyces amatae]
MDHPPDPIPEPRDREQDLATVDKTLAIYTALGSSKTPLYLRDLEQRCALPRRTIQRHLDYLESRGFVQRTGAGRYLLDPAARLPLGAADHDGIDRVLAEFTKCTGRDVALATLSGGRLAISHLHPSPEGESLLQGIDPRAMHATAAGKCLLAQLPNQERRRLMILTGMPRYTDRTITDVKRLDASLKAQQDEVWSAEGEYCETGACLAILAHPGTTYGDSIALTTSVQAAEFTQMKRELGISLLRGVARLQTVIGPLQPPRFGPVAI